jgi:hypothetical protein
MNVNVFISINIEYYILYITYVIYIMWGGAAASYVLALWAFPSFPYPISIPILITIIS